MKRVFETAECEQVRKTFHVSGAEISKTREPNERLCRGTERRPKGLLLVSVMNSKYWTLTINAKV